MASLPRVILWDIDGTLLRSPGIGVKAFRQSIRAHTGKELGKGPYDLGGRTDPDIGRTLLEGSDLLLVGHDVARKDIPSIVQQEADEFYLGLARTDARFELVARAVDSVSGASFELYRRRTAL